MSLVDLSFPAGASGLNVTMPVSLPDSVISGLPSRAAIFLKLFLVWPSSGTDPKGTREVLATVGEVEASLDANEQYWQA